MCLPPSYSYNTSKLLILINQFYWTVTKVFLLQVPNSAIIRIKLCTNEVTVVCVFGWCRHTWFVFFRIHVLFLSQLRHHWSRHRLDEKGKSPPPSCWIEVRDIVQQFKIYAVFVLCVHMMILFLCPPSSACMGQVLLSLFWHFHSVLY